MENWLKFNSEKPKYLHFFQKDFDFIAFETTTNDIKPFEKIRDIANKLNLKVEKTELFEPIFKNLRLKEIRPKEVVLIGCSYCVVNPIGKKVLDFNYTEYNNNRIDFISEYPNLSFLVNNLFEHNLKLIADFFLTDVEKIKQGKLDIRLGMQKRLMFNINNK